MIFSELYSAYYNAVARILIRLIERGTADDRELREIVAEEAFGESALTVLPALRSGRWQLLDRSGKSLIRHPPEMPLTLLQRRWLKAISLDPRIALFGERLPALDGVEPLFTPEDYTVFDAYCDGDPYTDPDYIARFRTVLRALREGRAIEAKMRNRHGREISFRCIPLRLEYSERDDKFRIETGDRYIRTVNLARLTHCRLTDKPPALGSRPSEPAYETLTLRITDERNALERALLHFAHFEKSAERETGGHYLLRVRYEAEDESELLIRILSFGHLVEILSPASLREKLRERLARQLALGLGGGNGEK